MQNWFHWHRCLKKKFILKVFVKIKRSTFFRYIITNLWIWKFKTSNRKHNFSNSNNEILWYYGQHMYWVFYKRRERKRAKISNNYSGYWFHEKIFWKSLNLPLVNTKSIRSGSASESLSLSTKVWTPPCSRVISFTTGKRGKLISNWGSYTIR